MESFIDLNQLEPIPYKNTIAVLNEYMLQNIDFLNKFGHFNENKLFEMEVVLDEIESKVLLLEKKLESVPPEFLNGLVVPPLQQQQQVAQPQSVQQQNDQNNAIPPPPPPPPYQETIPNQEASYAAAVPPPQMEQQQVLQPEQVQEEQPQQQEEVEDERLEKYKKLLSYGVNSQQLKMKMQMEGLDPNLLDKNQLETISRRSSQSYSLKKRLRKSSLTEMLKSFNIDFKKELTRKHKLLTIKQLEKGNGHYLRKQQRKIKKTNGQNHQLLIFDMNNIKIYVDNIKHAFQSGYKQLIIQYQGYQQTTQATRSYHYLAFIVCVYKTKTIQYQFIGYYLIFIILLFNLQPQIGMKAIIKI